MKGLKKENTPILKRCQIFHNYIRPHQGLNGKTPAQACGITVEGKNKGITLIQNAKTANMTQELITDKFKYPLVHTQSKMKDVSI